MHLRTVTRIVTTSCGNIPSTSCGNIPDDMPRTDGWTDRRRRFDFKDASIRWTNSGINN